MRLLPIIAVALLAILVGVFIGTGKTLLIAMLVFAPIGLAAVGIFLWRPIILGYLIVVLQYTNIDYHIIAAAGGGIAFIFFGLSVLLWVILIWTNADEWRFSRAIIWYTVFLCVAIVTTLLIPGSDPELVKEFALTILYSYAPFLTTFFLISDEKRLRKVAVILTWIGVILAAINLLEAWDADLINMSSSPGRSAGLHRNSNPSAEAIMACFILSYLVKQPLLFPARVLMLLGTFVTFSRASIGLMVLFIFYQEFYVQRPGMRRLAFSMVLIIGMLGALYYSGEYIERFGNTQVQFSHARIDRAMEGEFDDASTEFRLRAIGVNFNRYLNNPVFGGGGLSALEVSPHNQILYVAAEHGTVGLIIFLGFLFSMWRGLLRMPLGPERRVLIALALSQTAIMLVTHSQYHERFSMILYGLLCAGGDIYAGSKRGEVNTTQPDSQASTIQPAIQT